MLLPPWAPAFSRGAVRVVRSVFAFLLREDAADAEFIQEDKPTEEEE